MVQKRVLIIDDDPFVGEALKKVLLDAGYLPVVAHDGNEGVAKLDSGKFDLLVLDLNLPGLTGFDILDLAILRHASVPIVILTGLADQCESEALKGADALFEKPPDVPVLLTEIERLTSKPPGQHLRTMPPAWAGLRAKAAAQNHQQLVVPGLFTARKARTY